MQIDDQPQRASTYLDDNGRYKEGRGPFPSFNFVALAGRTLGAIPPPAQVLVGIVSVQIGAALAKLYGRQMHLNLDVDPEVLGGIRVQVGDEVINGSLADRLEDAGRRLAS